MASPMLQPPKPKECPMPTYEYRCKDCAHEFERVEHLSEHEGAHRCPKCGSENVEPVVAEFYAKTSRKS